MINDAELGIKMAENPLEALWEKVRRQSENEIKVLKDSLVVQEAVMHLAEDKLKELAV